MCLARFLYYFFPGLSLSKTKRCDWWWKLIHIPFSDFTWVIILLEFKMLTAGSVVLAISCSFTKPIWNTSFFLLMYMLLFSASSVVLIWFTARPYEWLLYHHNWEGSEWKQGLLKPVVRGVMPELFKIILTFKRGKVGGKKMCLLLDPLI